MAKYEEWLTADKLLLLEGWARQGLTDEQIATNIGVSRSTLSDWKKRYTDISDTLKKGKEIVDIQVENALLKRALGFEYIEVTEERILPSRQDGRHGGRTALTDPETEDAVLIVTKRVRKIALPDTTAQIFWLKNRRPDLWRDKQKDSEDPTIAIEWEEP